MDLFEAFFKSADLDGDGRISGAEAVAFFQGSNLPKHVLAQIWMHADQRQTGFLGRPEFYNALRLVTVAQSKRELTPEIVKAALYGPAAAKIPPPQINLPAKPAPYSSQPSAASAGQMAPPALPSSQAPNAAQNQQYFPPQHTQSPRPPQSMPVAPSVRPPQPNSAPAFPRGSMVGPILPNANVSNNWASGMSGGAPRGPVGMNQAPTGPVRPQSPVTSLSQPMISNSKALVVSGNGPAPSSGFGNDLFSANPSQPKPEPSVPSPSVNSVPATPPVSGGPQTSDKPNPLDSLGSFLRGPTSGQPPRPQTPASSSLQVSPQGSASTSFGAPAISAAGGNSTSNTSQMPWPKMKVADVQKYTKVFMEVDTDRDGKITGEQARNLFLSWRLPREILKQVWDLSDQDNDSMLSVREFCFALYLMERYREGRPLPSALPSNVMYDETLLNMTGAPKVPYGNAAWGPAPSPGFGPQQGMPGARPMAPGPRPPRPPMQFPQADGAKTGQRDLSATVLGDSFLNQTDGVDQSDSNLQEATATGKKVEEKIILDSKEKLEFYRTKMQDLVLFKSRCDNKLNEITERAIADKREAELLAKKYEEKYKQVAEIASKLTVEEATFRDIQERRMELQQAIVKMEQGGSADGILQVRADRIQSDLDELMRGLVDRCKKLSIDVKPTALIVLPGGWHPGIQEGAAVWDEEWDKFEDEGFGNELSFGEKAKSTPVQRNVASPENGSPADLFSNDDGKHSSPFSGVEQAFDSESLYNNSEDGSGRSPHGSPLGRTTPESPSRAFSDPHFEKSSEGDADTHRSFDDSNWGTFGNNDDVDSVWGFNTKDSTSYSFGDSDFGVKPINTGSPSSDSNAFPTRSPFFEDSVPPTPASKFGDSSPRYSEAGDSYFDNLSRFDSFRTTSDAGGFFSSSQPDRFTRFDSISSSKDFSQPDRFTRFDSISSSKDSGGHSRGFSSFDDNDPFGASGPFKVSSETPKKSSDNWNAF
ncbi:epidermal growth factor receptor substrate 15-like 1 [Punica granatum]|uniref:Uncharacterized protein n=2 Tax=Punica granatum TaxID=22663 RepID=A0A2I0JFQ6_PUNGR|nr:epidermal growth factor receptor substrate 15-like 1 [Punica granatum]PKI55101.1 hypothetical protein CRG98_024392 [Punica granatum]